jgi:hypothetical protein
VGGKTIEEWDRLWTAVPGGLAKYHSNLRSKVGLYRVCRNGKVMALGQGTDTAGGIAKRLSDFRRPSPSSRKHHAGELINGNLDDLKVEVLITGSGAEAQKLGRRLRTPMLRLHAPPWNVRDPSYRPRRAGRG